MKQFDLVRLTNEKPYKQSNLQKDMRGIVIGFYNNLLDVMFFNPHNCGDYAIVKINANDAILETESLPDKVKNELAEKIDTLKNKAKDIIEPIKIKAYDMVELLVEKERYSKYGVHKGDTGCVMDNSAIQNYVEVDFSGIDDKGNFYGDCISVKIDDLKILK